MVEIDNAFELKYKKGSEQFEVLVDFDLLLEFKKKPEEISVYDVLADNKIFKDQKKGQIASEQTLNTIFENKTEQEILKEILLKGTCQIPTAYINKLREEKKEQIINYIAQEAVNPQTRSKYTPSMISTSFSQITFNVDPQKDFVLQAEEALHLLKRVIPISMQRVLLAIKVPGQYCGSFYGEFRRKGTVKKEFYDDTGNLNINFEISESRLDDVINFIKKNTNNEGEYSKKN